MMLLVAHVAAALLVVLVLAAAGRWTARRTRQPEVVGEIAAGLFAGPVLGAVVGTVTLRILVPEDVLGSLKVVGEIGLALLLLGMAQELRPGPGRPSRLAAVWVTVGATVPALGAGAVLGWWLVVHAAADLRGGASGLSLMLFCSVALTISAVPVMLRIVEDRGLSGTGPARYALTAAVVIDGFGWVLLAVAVGMRSGSIGATVWVLVTMLAAVAVAVVVRRVLAGDVVSGLAARRPRAIAVVLGAGTVAAGLGTEQLGVTLIFGAVVFGLAVPASSPVWTAAVAPATLMGRRLVPVFFVVTGIAVLDSAVRSAPWGLVVAATLLAVVAKVGGGYAGARVGGLNGPEAARTGILLNTRGLTELIALQAGYTAGIVTPSLYLALVVMALVTTALTGPLLTLVDRHEARRTGRAQPCAAALRKGADVAPGRRGPGERAGR